MAQRVLSEVGWDDGIAIPVANAENKTLEEELQRKQKELKNIDNKLSAYKDRQNAVREHLKNVRQELTHTQALCKAREQEQEREVHLTALAEREAGRLRQELNRLLNQLSVGHQRENAHQNNIFKATQKLEEIKHQLKFDQQTLDAWLAETARKDEDAMVIAKYARQDESRIREVVLSIEKLTLESNQKRKALDNEFTETATAQIALEKTAESFRQASVERTELIRQWENTIQQMSRRDGDMQQCALMLAEVKQAIRRQDALMKDKKKFLANEMENNKECEKKIGGAERQGVRLRQQLREQESSRAGLQDEVEVLKGIVDRTATDLETMRSQLTNMKKEIREKTAKLEEAGLYNTALEEKLQVVMVETLSVEERAAQMDQIFQDQEKRLKEIESQQQRQHELLFRKSQELQSLRAKEKSTAAGLNGSRTALCNLSSRLAKLNQQALKQQEIMYNQDFQIQLLERKMARLRGEVNTEEKQALERRTSELSVVLEEKRKTVSMLSTQLKKLQDDTRLIRKETEKIGAEKRDLTTKMDELHLFIDNSKKELKKLCLKKQDSMVEGNILKLEVKQVQGELYEQAGGVLSQEKRRLQLDAAMKERQEEVRVHRDMLAKQTKIADQERQGLSTEVHERLSRIEKMKKKYEILTVSTAPPEGEEEKSQTYYVIKAAQEKEELQREGDDLDAKIRRTEKEIKALENTLHMVNDSNSVYKKSFNKVSESSPEYLEKLKLLDQKRAAEEKCRYKRRQIREHQDDLQNMSSSQNVLLQDEATQSMKTDDTRACMLTLSKELSSQQEKLARVTKQCSKLTKEIRSAKKTKEKTFEERDIDLKRLKDQNKTVKKMLLEAMDEHPDLQATLQQHFAQANVPLPSPSSTPASRLSSKISSARSSSSLRSSASSTASSHRGSAVRTVELGLGLSISSPAGFSSSPQSSRPASSSSSGSSLRSSQLQSP